LRGKKNGTRESLKRIPGDQSGEHGGHRNVEEASRGDKDHGVAMYFKDYRL